MKSTISKLRLNQSTNILNTLKSQNFNNLYFTSQKHISINRNKNYFEPSNEEEQIEDVKQYLNKTKPKFLCTYFTNEWNPVCKESNLEYTNFTVKTGAFHNLVINVDKFPKLKWYYDSKFEPGFHLYYYGTLVKKIGGANYERVLSEIKRVQDFITNENIDQKVNQHNSVYEQPYFHFEQNINTEGRRHSLDSYQRFTNFAPNYFVIGRTYPFEENWINQRLKQ